MELSNKKIIFSTNILITILATTSAYANTSKKNWEGLYGGVAIGSLVGKAPPDSKALAADSSSYFVENASGSDLEQLNPFLQQELKSTELNSSILIGYDIQNGSWVYGVEGDLTLASYSATNSEGPVTYDTASTINFSTHNTVETDYALSARLRVGYLIDDFMFHVAVGPVVSQFKYKFSYSETGTSASVTTPESFNASNTEIGVSSNIGATYQLGNNWSLRGDYIYNYYPEIVNERHEFDVGSETAIFNHESGFESQNFRFAIIRKF